MTTVKSLYDIGFEHGYVKGKAEAEPIVRCKDCTYWEQAKPDSGSCNRAFEITAYANDFCSYGERKDWWKNETD